MGRLSSASLILDGVAMLWFDVLNVQGHTIKRGKCVKKISMKSGEGTCLNNNNTKLSLAQPGWITGVYHWTRRIPCF